MGKNEAILTCCLCIRTHVSDDLKEDDVIVRSCSIAYMRRPPVHERQISNLTFIGPCIILIVEYRETNLMPLVLLLLYSVLNKFRTLIHPYGGVVSVCRLQPAYGYHTTIATLQRNTNTHRTRYNP